MLRRIGVLLVIVLFLGIGSSLYAQTDEVAPFRLEPLLTETITRPLFLEELPDGTRRMLVIQQSGIVHLIANGQLADEPFLDIEALVNDNGNERGLLGLAVHPDFANNGHVFVYYTRDDGASVVARYQVSDTDPNVADPENALQILLVAQPYRNHNAGMIAFGPDGYLYVALGDGGNRDDPFNYGQNPNELLGSILRLDVDNASLDEPYRIPDGNPFADDEKGAPEVWVWGLRNPWRFSFDRETGDLYIGDVGQNRIEEVDFVPVGTGGLNFGWDAYEGSEPYYTRNARGETIPPIFEYTHQGGCAVTGGHVYRGAAVTALQGKYVVGDFCSGILWALTQTDDDAWQSEILMDTDLQIASFSEDLSGELYVLAFDGNIYQVLPAE